MITMSLERAANITHGQVRGAAQTLFSGVNIDSRQVCPGNLFIAFRGQHVDGHDYVAEAQSAGAVAALVERPLSTALAQLVVQDVGTALAQLAAAWRHQQAVTVVGITGSNGKTTVKNLLASILQSVAPTLATPGNFNNELGLPLTLCQLSPEHRFAVLEMGARQPGDIEVLAALAAHQVGVLTNAGPAHLETFGSLQGVARAKAEIFTSLPADGRVVINADDPFADYWQQRCEARLQWRFGRGPNAQVRSNDSGPQCRVHTPAGDFTTTLQLHGAHNVMNALAATAAALALEIPLAAIAGGLAATPAASGRLQYHQTSAGWAVIDDTYNANPASLYAAINTALTESANELWLVLGDMGELGDDTRKLHAEMGDAARQLGVTRLFATGQLTAHAVHAFGSGGTHFANQAELITHLQQALHPGVRCLVKGSRAAGMEHVVAALLAPATGEVS